MKLTGHKTEAVYRRYAIVSEADLAAGVTRLAVLHESLTKGTRTVVPMRPVRSGGDHSERGGCGPPPVAAPRSGPPVEAAPIREVEVCQPRLPLGTKEGGGDRVGLTVVLGHRSRPLVAALNLEALLVPHRKVPVPHEVIAGKVEEGLGE